MAISVIQSELATGNSTSDPITATLTGVVARRWMLAFGSAYNPGTIGASAFSDDQTSPSNSWSNVVEEPTGSDVFNLAFGAAKVANGGTVIGQFAPSAGRYPTYCLFEVDAPWNAQLNTPKVHEWTGTTLNFSFNAPAHAATAYPSTDWQAYLGLSWYSDDDPTAALVSDGWAVLEKQTNFSGLTQTLAVLSKSGSGTSGPTVNVATGISGSNPAVAIGVILAAPPATWSDSVDIVNSQTAQIQSLWMPLVDGTYIITCDVWTPTNRGTDPTTGMISSNNGGSFTRDHLLPTDEYDIFEDDAHGLAHIRHVVESDATEPYEFDIDLGEAGSYGQWTATYYPNIDNATNPVLYTGKDFKPHTGDDPNILPQTIPCATAPINIQWSNVWISTTAANGGHEGVVDVNAPPGYTSRHEQNENSLTYSGHTADKFLETPGEEHPIYDVDQPVSPEAGTGSYMRGSMVVYRTTSSVQESGSALPIIMQMLH